MKAGMQYININILHTNVTYSMRETFIMSTDSYKYNDSYKAKGEVIFQLCQRVKL